MLSPRKWRSHLLHFCSISAHLVHGLLICMWSDWAGGRVRMAWRIEAGPTILVSIYNNACYQKWEEKSESASHFLPRSFSLIQLDLSHDTQEAFSRLNHGKWGKDKDADSLQLFCTKGDTSRENKDCFFNCVVWLENRGLSVFIMLSETLN